MILINKLISAILQVVILIAIPFIFYLVKEKRVKGFFNWIGFKTTENNVFKYMAIIFISFLVIIILPYLYLYNTNSLTYTGFTVDAYKQYGWSMQTILVILIWAVVQTSLSEEIFFRGFLGNRLFEKLGNGGNVIQAIIFGGIHIVSVVGKGILPMVIIFLLTGGIGYALGWLSRNKADGSIIYGWIIHAAVNIISPIVVFMFLI